MFKKLFVLALAVLCVLSLAVPALADEQKEALTVGVALDGAPFGWEQKADASNKKLVQIKGSEQFAYGYDVIIASRLASKIGCELELVKLERKDFEKALKDGTVDVVMGCTDKVAFPEGAVAFTSPYYYDNTVVMTSVKYKISKASDLVGKKVFVAQDRAAVLEEIEGAEAVEYSDTEVVLENLENGELDAAVVGRTFAKAALVNRSATHAICDFYGTDGDFKSAPTLEYFAVLSSDNTALLEKLNTEIDKLALVNGNFSFGNYDSTMHTAITLNPDFIYAASKGTSFFGNITKLIQRYGTTYLTGAGTTLLISIVGTFFGCLIGFVVGIIQTIPVDKKRDNWFKRGFLATVRGVLRAYVEVFRGTPMIVQAVFIYYGAQIVFDLKMDMWTAAFFIVSINTGAYMAETVRGGIMSIDIGQTEGSKAIGMTHVQTMVHVILPQTFRVIIPQIGNNFIINIKDTSVLSVISITDLFFSHKAAVGALYTYFESATIVMLIYLTMTMITSVLLRMLERKLGGEANYDVATKDQLALTSGTYNFPKKSEGGKR